jgi:hypothetical protein
MKGIWPWVIGGAVLLGGYFLVYKPLTTPGGRQIIGGALAGDSRTMGRGIITAIESNPQAKQQILNDPEKMKKYNELKQKYGANYARVSVYGR